MYCKLLIIYCRQNLAYNPHARMVNIGAQRAPRGGALVSGLEKQKQADCSCVAAVVC